MENNIDYAAIGQRLKAFRKENKITQDDIAKDLGVTVAYISNIENNKVKMNLKVLSYYATRLGVSIDYLLYTDTSKTSSLDAEIIKQIRTLSDDEKEKLIKMVRIYKNEQ